jgi:hypothetical protein
MRGDGTVVAMHLTCFKRILTFFSHSVEYSHL